MYSQGCATWTDDSSFLWASGGITSSNGVRAYAIYTYATGYDRCYSSDPWNRENSTNGTSYNANWNGAGKGVGYYLDCGQGASHAYQVNSEHYWQATSGGGLVIQEGGSFW